MLLSQSVARASDAASPLRKAWMRTQAPGTELEMCAKLGDAIKRLQGHASDISVELAHSVPLGTARRTLFVDLGQEMDLLEVTIEAIDNTDSSVQFAEGLLSVELKTKGKEYKVENMPLFLEIDADESKWFRNDR